MKLTQLFVRERTPVVAFCGALTVAGMSGCGRAADDRSGGAPAQTRSADSGAALNDGDAAAFSGLLHHVYGPNRETTGFAVDQGRQRVEIDLRTMGEEPTLWANRLVDIDGYWTVAHGAFFPNRWIVVATSIQQLNSDLTCAGPSKDGTQNLAVLGFKDASGNYARVILQQYVSTPPNDPETLADYDQHQDVTPPPPSDVRFRYVFGVSAPTTSDYIITLTEGGFTDMAVVEVKKVTADGSVVVGNMNCGSSSP